MVPALLLVPVVVANSALTMPLPKGYKDITADAVKKVPALKNTGALVIQKDDIVSINVVPGEHHPEDDLSNATECAKFATEMQEHLHGQSSKSAIVEGPSGKTCQIAITHTKPRVTTISTILQGPKNTWTLTCTMPPTDVDAARVCQDLVKTIKFK